MSTTNLDPDHITGENASDRSSPPETKPPVIVSISSINSGKTAAEETRSSSVSVFSAASVLTSSASTESSTPDTHPISERDDSSIRFERLDFDSIAQDSARTGTYTGALLLMVTEVAIVASLISAIARVVDWPHKGVILPDWLMWFIGTPLLLGTVPTIVFWLLLALIVRRSTAVDRMNMSSYGELLSHLSALDAQLISLARDAKEIPQANRGDRTSVQLPRSFVTNMDIKEVLGYRDIIYQKLIRRSQGWVTAIGYVDLWKEMHSAEAALIDVMPLKAVIAEALGDELRIQGSNIKTSEELLRKLRIAVQVLDPAAAIYLQPLSANPQGESASLGVAVDETHRQQARAVLREVRQTLNAFRDDRWQTIVRVRNQLVATTIFTGIVMYVLLQFVIFAGTSQWALISATACFLVGALVGLFGRLLSESQMSKTVDDYRLAMVRLLALPLYSGLAAVGGVLFVQEFSSLQGDVFTWKTLLSSLIIAASFGLTPNFLVNRLQKQVEQQNSDLKSTGASSSSE
jgi:hypothetical protein